MKDLNLKTIELDGREARKFLDEAKDALRAIPGKKAQEVWWLVDQADARIDGLLTYVSLRSEVGARGGAKTAERGPEYFKKIAAMRKTKAGGRPKKQASGSDTP